MTENLWTSGTQSQITNIKNYYDKHGELKIL